VVQKIRAQGLLQTGVFLRQHRLALELTQKNVALKLGVHPMFVSNFENGKAPVPPHHLNSLAKLYKIPKKRLLNHLLKVHENKLSILLKL